ncbi:MAG: efflux RND transporter permease subunit [Cyanobacteriota bacterium]
MKPEKTSALFEFFFIKPVFSSLLLIMMIISGLIAYGAMIKESNPDLEIPQALIITTWPSASPDLIEKEITNKIEKKLKSLKNLKNYSSGSLDSVSIISVKFQADAPMQESMQMLQTKVREAEADLPEKAKKPKIEPFSISDIPIMTFMLYGNLDDALLSDAAKDIKTQLEKITGIKKVEISGNRKEIVQVQLLPERLNSLGISPTIVRERINEANQDMPWNKLENPDFTANLKLAGRFDNIKALKELPIIRLPQGRVIRLEELAIVKRDLATEKNRTFISKDNSDYQKCITLSVYKLPGQDTIELIDKSKAVINQIETSSDWPHGMKYEIMSDESVLIWENLLNVFNNCWQGMLAVFVVLFIMLTWREALICGLSIPITLMGTLAILYALGNSLNEIVIIGMILAFGIMVDDFILIMEGMHHAMSELKLSIEESQWYTLKTFAIPSLSGSLTTIIVFIPLMCVGGVDGKFIRLIPITAAICLVISYFVSVFINVPLSALFLKNQKSVSEKTFVDTINDKASAALLVWLKEKALCSKRVAIFWVLGTMLLFILSIAAAGILPSTLYPKADGRNFGISIELSPNTSLDDSQELADKVGKVLTEKKYLKSVVKYIGKKSPFSVNSSSEYLTVTEAPYLIGFSCLFTPKEQREKMAFEYAKDLRDDIEPLLKDIPGAMMVMTPDVGGATNADPIQIVLSGNDMDHLRKNSAQIQELLANTPGITDVRDNLGPTSEDINVLPNREALEFYGLNFADMAMQIRLAMADDEVGKFKMPGIEDDLDIILGFSWPSRKGDMGGPKSWEEVSIVGVFDKNGQRIPVLSILTPVIDAAPLSITHYNGQRSVTVMAKTEDRTVEEILEEIEPHIKKLKKDWPKGFEYQFAGEAESSSETYASMGQAFIIALFLVFAILTILFNNYKQPFIIMFSVLFAMIGVFGGFFLAWIPISFPALIGIISLVGIVVNDAIVMIDTMNIHTRNNLPLIESAARGASDRLRPILSTTVTTAVGLIPLALSDPLWMPLCTAIIFGLLAATVVSLIIVPCIYFLLMTKWGEAK